VFDTNLVVVGNVLTAPEWRRITNTGSLVANFRIASTARRFDRETGRWVDGNSFRVRVTAWRRLAEGVASSVAVGDPVVVYGRLYSRDWKDEKNNNRVSYEMEAFSIGHDLARGRAKFFRTKSAQVTSELETSDAQTCVRGEASVPVTADEAPVGYGDGLPDQLAEHEPMFLDVVAGEEPESVVAASADSPAGPAPVPVPVPVPEAPAVSSPSEESPSEESPSEADDLTIEVERLVAEQPATTRRRRGAKREPVAV
jgi:single-strand DNA-binding protein